ncbi:uncharacterized protein LOC143288435 [Babylonia areolata]|uniref:uncharacterized protein LOC143288435 n=1 Tax=Babylonia areolata TaxID=304850 RepID=UPI003FD059FD
MGAPRDMANAQIPRLRETLETQEKPFQNFHSKLDGIPHSFQLQNTENARRSGLRYLMSTLESALAVGYATSLETARAHNLLAYLHFRLEQPSEALSQIETVLSLEGQQHNLVSLANKAVILWRSGQRTRAETLVKTLQRMRKELPEFPYLVVKARAELAFSYTRCLPDCYPLAQALFSEVIPQAADPEVWLWKFGLAFTRRRMLRPNFSAGSKQQDEYLEVLQLFMDIVKGCKFRSLKAKAYAELALLMSNPRSADVKQLLRKESGVTILQACEAALELDATDNSVLWKCGKLYRYFREIEKSLQLLKKAVSTRPTSKAYHNLGLTYKAMALNDKETKSAQHENETPATSDIGPSTNSEVSPSSDITMTTISNSTMATTSNSTMATTSNSTMATISNSTMATTSNSTMATTSNSTMATTSNSTMATTSNSTMATTSNSTMATTIDSQQPPHSEMLEEKGTEVSTKSDSCTSTGTDPVSEILFSRFLKQQSRNSDTETQYTTDVELSYSSQCSSSDNQLSGDAALLHKDNHVPTAGLENNAVTSRSEASPSALGDNGGITEKSTREDFADWKIAKCPLTPFTKLSKEDPYVTEAIESLKQAAEISMWGNSAAIYDLALIYRNIGELEQAKKSLETTLSQGLNLGTYYRVSYYEQLGLVLGEMAEQSPSEESRTELQEYSQSMLLTALQNASHMNPPVRGGIETIWNSFHSLMKAVKRNDKGSAETLQDKALLFRLIKKHKKSLALLQDIERLHPEKSADPEHLKLCIENYVQVQQYEEALTFIDLLQCTAHNAAITQLFEDPRFLQKVYLHAANQSLQRGSPNFKSHFRAVFSDIVQPDTCTSSEDTEEAKTPAWDVHILHEETEEDTDVAAGLVSLLRDVCGLTATRMDEDVMAGFDMEGVFGIMRRSKVLVVIAGTQKPSLQLRYLINMAARRPTSVSVVVKGGRVPRLMKPRRSMDLPSELPQITCGPKIQDLTPQNFTAICALVGFMADVDFDEEGCFT